MYIHVYKHIKHTVHATVHIACNLLKGVSFCHGEDGNNSIIGAIEGDLVDLEVRFRAAPSWGVLLRRSLRERSLLFRLGLMFWFGRDGSGLS